MGYPMARNLIRAGHEVALWSHNGAKAVQLAQEETGGTACKSPREVAERAECVFACVGDTKMAEDVFVGPQGVLQGAKSGSVAVDASTISPEASRAIGKKLAEKGIDFIDAPCTGSTPGAAGGTLTFMIGGDKAVFERVKPYFDVMGKRFYHCGGPGLGLQAKLSQNLLLCNILQAMNESMVLSTKAGIDPQLMFEILDNSAAKSGLVSYKLPFVFKRDFTANFSTKWMRKDIALALQSGEELGVPLPLTSLTGQVFQSAISEGYGDIDMCATIRVLERFAGVEVKPK